MTMHPTPDFGPMFAGARATDPQTSHRAAESVEKSGRAQTQRSRILAVLSRLRRSTAGEIASRLDGIDRHTVSKRLPELERRGSVKRMDPRKCTAHGTEMTTWDLA